MSQFDPEKMFDKLRREVDEMKSKGEKFPEIPKVFIDGHSGVKVSIVSNFVNCVTKRDPEFPGTILEGCFMVRENGLRPVEGIFYIPVFKKVNPAGYRRTLAIEEDEIKQVVHKELENVEKRIRLLINKNRWLIKYRKGDIKVYINAVKGKQIEFDLRGTHGKLKIMRVPPTSLRLRYELTDLITVYNHRLEFSDKVVRFRVYSMDGIGELIYTYSGTVDVKISSPDHGEKEITLYGGEMYLITHPRPIRY